MLRCLALFSLLCALPTQVMADSSATCQAPSACTPPTVYTKPTTAIPVPPPCFNATPGTDPIPARIDLPICSYSLNNPKLTTLADNTKSTCVSYQQPLGLIDRVQQFYSYKVACFYQKVLIPDYPDPIQVDPKHDGSCVGTNLAPTPYIPVCNYTDNETTLNNLNQNCSAAQTTITSTPIADTSTIIDASYCPSTANGVISPPLSTPSSTWSWTTGQQTFFCGLPTDLQYQNCIDGLPQQPNKDQLATLCAALVQQQQSVTIALQNAAYTSTVYSSSHFLGLQVQLLKFYSNQVIQEVLPPNNALQVSASGSCTNIAQDYLRQNQCAQFLSSSILTPTGITTFPLAFFTTPLDLCTSTSTALSALLPTQISLIPKAAACQMDANLQFRTAVFETLMHCEIQWRIQAFMTAVQPVINKNFQQNSLNATADVEKFFKTTIVMSATNNYQDISSQIQPWPTFNPTTSSAPCPSL